MEVIEIDKLYILAGSEAEAEGGSGSFGGEGEQGEYGD